MPGGGWLLDDIGVTGAAAAAAAAAVGVDDDDGDGEDDDDDDDKDDGNIIEANSVANNGDSFPEIKEDAIVSLPLALALDALLTGAGALSATRSMAADVESNARKTASSSA